MIAIDTILLVYAHRPEMPFHDRARLVLSGAVGGPEPVSVPWPCVHKFLAVVSNPRIFKDPTPIGVALDATGRLLESLTGGFLSEGEGYPKAKATSVLWNGSPDRLCCKAQSCTMPGSRRYACITAYGYSGLPIAISRASRIWRWLTHFR